MTTIRSEAELAVARAIASRTEALFKASGALKEGHFLLKSGKHSERYLEKFLVLQDPAATSELCGFWASAHRGPDGTPLVDVVAGPTTGGVVLANVVTGAAASPWKIVKRYGYRPELSLQEFVCENNRNVDANGAPILTDTSSVTLVVVSGPAGGTTRNQSRNGRRAQWRRKPRPEKPSPGARRKHEPSPWKKSPRGPARSGPRGPVITAWGPRP